MILVGLRGVIYRELRLYGYSRLNIVLSVTTPFLYALLLATSLDRAVGRVNVDGIEVAYSVFVVPGLVVLALVTSVMTSAQSVFQERDSGMLLEILSCPITTNDYVFGKFVGTTIVGSMHGILLLGTMSLLFRIPWGLPYIFLAIVAIPLACLLIVSLYLVVCSLLKSLQTFILTMNLLSMVLMFSSTIFYPAEALPTPLKFLSFVNPVSLAAKLMRVILIGPAAELARVSLVFVVTCALLVTFSVSLLRRKLENL